MNTDHSQDRQFRRRDPAQGNARPAEPARRAISFRSSKRKAMASLEPPRTTEDFERQDGSRSRGHGQIQGCASEARRMSWEFLSQACSGSDACRATAPARRSAWYSETKNALESALARAENKRTMANRSIQDLAAAYLFGIARNHAVCRWQQAHCHRCRWRISDFNGSASDGRQRHALRIRHGASPPARSTKQARPRSSATMSSSIEG